MMTYALINPQSNLLLQPKPLLQWKLWKLHRKLKRSATSQIQFVLVDVCRTIKNVSRVMNAN